MFTSEEITKDINLLINVSQNVINGSIEYGIFRDLRYFYMDKYKLYSTPNQRPDRNINKLIDFATNIDRFMHFIVNGMFNIWNFDVIGCKQYLEDIIYIYNNYYSKIDSLNLIKLTSNSKYEFLMPYVFILNINPPYNSEKIIKIGESYVELMNNFYRYKEFIGILDNDKIFHPFYPHLYITTKMRVFKDIHAELHNYFINMSLLDHTTRLISVI
jgi:hypothetical protein